jgi:hypothetical protein
MNISQFLGGKVVARSNFKGLLRVFIPQDFRLVIRKYPPNVETSD